MCIRTCVRARVRSCMRVRARVPQDVEQPRLVDKIGSRGSSAIEVRRHANHQIERLIVPCFFAIGVENSLSHDVG